MWRGKQWLRHSYQMQWLPRSFGYRKWQNIKRRKAQLRIERKQIIARIDDGDIEKITACVAAMLFNRCHQRARVPLSLRARINRQQAEIAARIFSGAKHGTLQAWAI